MGQERGEKGMKGRNVRRDRDRERVDRDNKDTFGHFNLHAGSSYLEDQQPEWMNESLENMASSDHDGFGASADRQNSVREFEVWKAQMKVQELRKAGYDVPDAEELIEEDMRAGIISQDEPRSRRQEQVEEEESESTVDNLFGVWDGPTDPPSSANGHSQSASNRATAPSAMSSKASRFSSFFRGSAPSPASSPVNQRSGHVPPPSSASVPSPNATHDNKNDTDKEGFSRIMAMLGGNGGAPDPSQQLQSLQQQNEMPSRTSDSNDQFFKSLLNKSASESPAPASSPLSVTAETEKTNERQSTTPKEQQKKIATPQYGAPPGLQGARGSPSIDAHSQLYPQPQMVQSPGGGMHPLFASRPPSSGAGAPPSADFNQQQQQLQGHPQAQYFIPPPPPGFSMAHGLPMGPYPPHMMPPPHGMPPFAMQNMQNMHNMPPGMAPSMLPGMGSVPHDNVRSPNGMPKVASMGMHPMSPPGNNSMVPPPGYPQGYFPPPPPQFAQQYPFKK